MEIKIFKNNEFGAVRVLRDENNEPWFVGKDVCDILGYSNPKDAIAKHIDPEDKKILRSQNATLENIPNRGITIINESGLYSLILKSKLPQAKKFKRWVTNEVLPAIRKYGMYMTNSVIETIHKNPREFLKLVQNYVEAVEKINLLTHSKKTYTTTEIAKELGFRSAVELNKKLQEMKIQYKVNGTWVLSAKYAESGYESIKQTTLPTGKIVYDRRWTQKGREFLLDLFSTANSTKSANAMQDNNSKAANEKIS